MGGVLSKGKSAASAPAEEAHSLPTDITSNSAHEQDARTSTTLPAVSQASKARIQNASPPVSNHAGGAELPADMQFILESGLHEETEDGDAANKAQQGSIQDAVNDIKAKYNLNQPVASGELERIRKEIELKTRLMEMREAQKQRRMAAQASSQPSTTEQQIYKVDLKGKGRADPNVDE